MPSIVAIAATRGGVTVQIEVLDGCAPAVIYHSRGDDAGALFGLALDARVGAPAPLSPPVWADIVRTLESTGWTVAVTRPQEGSQSTTSRQHARARGAGGI